MWPRSPLSFEWPSRQLKLKVKRVFPFQRSEYMEFVTRSYPGDLLWISISRAHHKKNISNFWGQPVRLKHEGSWLFTGKFCVCEKVELWPVSIAYIITDGNLFVSSRMALKIAITLATSFVPISGCNFSLLWTQCVFKMWYRYILRHFWTVTWDLNFSSTTCSSLSRYSVH